MRRLGGLKAVVLAAVVAAVVPLAVLRFVPAARQALTPPDLGQGDYRLLTTNGQSFTADSLKGAPSLVFFGFTHCPDVCPTTLGDIATWTEELGPAAQGLRVFMVSVDPERDSAGILGDYLSWLPGAVGVTGTPDEVAKAIRAFRVFARKVPLEGGDYTMDHSSSVMVFDASGRLQTTISYQAPLDEALSRLRGVLGQG